MEHMETKPQERTEALKVVCKMAKDSSKLPRCMIQALIAIIESHRDAYCYVCIEILCQIGTDNAHLTHITVPYRNVNANSNKKCESCCTL